MGRKDPVLKKALTAAADLLHAQEQAMSKPRTLRQIVILYQKEAESRGDLAPTTLKSYEGCARALVQILGDVAADSVYPDDVARIRADLLAAPYRASTVRKFLNYLRQAWRWGERQGLILRPWPEPPPLRTKQRSQARTSKRAYTVTELATVLTSLGEDPLDSAFRLLIQVGCRVGEVRELDVGDVRDGCVVFRATKTGRERVVPVLPRLFDELRGCAGARQRGALLRGRRGGRLPVSYLREKLSALLDLHGMARVVGSTLGRSFDLDLHSFRRSWISHAAQGAGVPESVRCAVTGHSYEGAHRGYERNSVSIGMRARAVLAVADWRLDQLSLGPLDSAQPTWHKPSVINGLASSRWNRCLPQALEPQGLPEDVGDWLAILVLLSGGGADLE